MNILSDRKAGRLSAETARLASRYIAGEMGKGMSDEEFSFSREFQAESRSQTALYAEAIMVVAENAPVRLVAGERIAGAATLKKALKHFVPVIGVGSISHTTLGFEKALTIGASGIRREIQDKLDSRTLDGDGTELLNAMLKCLDAFKIWCERYRHAAEELALESSGKTGENYKKIATMLENVPENPPGSFHEAVQSLWLFWDFQRLCGNWSGIGRFDKMLAPYFKKDIADGKLTIDEAREIIAHFWIKGCEWIGGGHWESGDAQFYQNIVLSGVDSDGNDITNEITYLVLDVVEELHISDFPIAVRISRKTSERLLRRIGEIQRLGGGIVAIYNDDRIIPSLVKYGYPLEEARDFANDGCWEILIPGKTRFSYQPFDVLLLLQETLGLSPEGSPSPEFLTFEELYADFRRRLENKIEDLVNLSSPEKINPPDWQKHPTVLVDMMVEGCIEKGRSYLNLGPKYTMISPHAGGLQDAANSLLAIRTMVFEKKELRLREFIEIIRNNWEGREDLRIRIRESFDFYGNDAPESDSMMRKVYDDYTEIVGREKIRNGVLHPAGISTFGREGSEFLPKRTASAAGTRKGDVLALNFTPAPGTDKRGPTAVIKSHCCVDFSKLPCGTALDLRISPSSLNGESGIMTLMSLSKTFVELGGIFLQIDVIDSKMLRDAQENPEKYPNLSVRISGWSARFATLSRQWQEVLINRTEMK